MHVKIEVVFIYIYKSRYKRKWIIQQIIQTEIQFMQKRMMNIVVDRTCYRLLYAWLNVQKHVLTQMQTKSINTGKCADQQRNMLIYRLVSGGGMQKTVLGFVHTNVQVPCSNSFQYGWECIFMGWVGGWRSKSIVNSSVWFAFAREKNKTCTCINGMGTDLILHQ